MNSQNRRHGLLKQTIEFTASITAIFALISFSVSLIGCNKDRVSKETKDTNISSLDGKDETNGTTMDGSEAAPSDSSEISSDGETFAKDVGDPCKGKRVIKCFKYDCLANNDKEYYLKDGCTAIVRENKCVLGCEYPFPEFIFFDGAQPTIEYTTKAGLRQEEARIECVAVQLKESEKDSPVCEEYKGNF